MPLTALAIKHLKPKAKMYRVADGGGLCLEVSPAGGKLWRWRYTFHGKAQMLALGKYPAVSLEQARRKRDEARILVDAGKHPIPKERMKMKRPHIVPLSRQAIAVLKDLHTKTGQKINVFHSQRGKKNKHISNGAVLMALRRMGYQNRMTGHGFRSLASTILNEKHYPPDVIERQLAHEDGDKIRSAYNRAEYLLERKKMMQAYADYLDSVLTDADKKVVRGNFSKNKQH